MSKLQLYNYLKTAKVDTKYAKRMQRLSNRIFGEVVRPTPKPSMRVVALFSKKPVEQLDHLTDAYYPDHPTAYHLMSLLRDLGLYRDEHKDFQEEMERMRVLRGKGFRKYGEGKKNEPEGAA